MAGSKFVILYENLRTKLNRTRQHPATNLCHGLSALFYDCISNNKTITEKSKSEQEEEFIQMITRLTQSRLQQLWLLQRNVYTNHHQSETLQ